MSDLAGPEAPVSADFRGLPRRIHIGHFTFRIYLRDETGNAILADAWGNCDCQKAVIDIHKETPAWLAANTVQHEITHAINFVYGITDETTEEQFTTQHTNGLIEVLLKNPRYATWLARQLRAMRKEASHD
jgi:type I restriction-modification system DNA methylase subunit